MPPSRDGAGPLRVHVGPGRPELIERAVAEGGGVLAGLDVAEAVVWVDPRPQLLPPLPQSVRWVQLPGAGVDRWTRRMAAAPWISFTSAAGVYARPVAEHALTLLLAGVRGIAQAARATSWATPFGGGSDGAAPDGGGLDATTRWAAPEGGGLDGATVAVVGAGGIGGRLVELLAPLDVEVLAVTRSGRAVPGATRTLPKERLGEVWPAADHVVLAAPATAETRHLVGAPELAAMRGHAWLVNVARGALVDTDALVAALREERIGGCALDVVDPEPLPPEHPLWREPRALITPHAGARPRAPRSPHFAAHVRENVARFAAGRELLARVDGRRGY